MTIKKSIFKKYLLSSISIIIISFLILSCILMVLIARYWQSEKKSILQKNILSISHIVAEDMEHYNNSPDSFSTHLMSDFLDALAFNIDADIIITDTDGKVIMCTNYIESESQNIKIDHEIISSALSSEHAFTSIADLDDIHKGNHYIVSVPIFDKDNTAIGVAIAAADINPISNFILHISIILLSTSLATLLLSFLFTWILSRNVVKPIKHMSTAADAFAKGDFSIRVHVKTNDEIGQLACAFNNMADSLANSESTRRSFVANVSHELKTPMTTISGFIDGMLDGTIPEDQYNHYLKIVSNETKRLSRLVKTMLDLSRIENGCLKIDKKPFDISKIITLTMISFEKTISDKNICVKGLDMIKSTFVCGDSDMINQVIYNLIENAVKFTNTNGYIKIDVNEDEQNVNVSIENSGHGIPQKDIQFIFDKFYKTDKSRSENKNGMGLGLYIVKKIINLHKGQINVESKVNEYSRFYFSLPK